jgi:hypothetical protein
MNGVREERDVYAKFNFGRVEEQVPSFSSVAPPFMHSSVTSKNSIYNSCTPQNLV